MDVRTYCRNMVYIWLLYHSAHSVLDRAVGEFVICVLFPNFLKIKVRASNPWLQELQVSSMRHRFCVIIEMLVKRSSERLTLYFGIVILCGRNSAGCSRMRCISSDVTQ